MSIDPERKYYIKIVLIVYVIWIVLFEVIGRFAATLPTHNPTTFLDTHIPFIPQFIWAYELCYLFPLLPLFIVKNFHRLNVALLSIFLANITAFIIYIIYPIAFPHPELGHTLSDKLLQMEISLDFQPGANKLPSLHVTFAWIVYFTIYGQMRKKFFEILVLVITILITVSTLFVKQHIIPDVVTGIIWAFVAWWISSRLYPKLTDINLRPLEALQNIIGIPIQKK